MVYGLLHLCHKGSDNWPTAKVQESYDESNLAPLCSAENEKKFLNPDIYHLAAANEFGVVDYSLLIYHVSRNIPSYTLR